MLGTSTDSTSSGRDKSSRTKSKDSDRSEEKISGSGVYDSGENSHSSVEEQVGKKKGLKQKESADLTKEIAKLDADMKSEEASEDSGLLLGSSEDASTDPQEFVDAAAA